MYVLMATTGTWLVSSLTHLLYTWDVGMVNTCVRMWYSHDAAAVLMVCGSPMRERVCVCVAFLGPWKEKMLHC